MSDRHDDNLPRALLDALRRGDAPPPIPESVDRAVMLRATMRLRAVRRARLVRRAASVAAVAAVFLLAVWWGGRDRPAPERPDATRADRHDIDGDGVVDMVDAFVLWKSGEQAGAPDVAAVERRAVSVR